MTTYGGTSVSNINGISSLSTIATDAANFVASGTGSNAARAVNANSTDTDAIAAVSGSAAHSGVWGSNSNGGTGVAGSVSGGTAGYGIQGVSYNLAGYGVYASNVATGVGGAFAPTALYASALGGINATAIYAKGMQYGVYGLTAQSGGIGVNGIATSGLNGTGVTGWTNGGVGVSGYAPIGTGNYAGDFTGDVAISGHLSKGTGTFLIDHPLDPENKYLAHSFVESPDMKNIYDGIAITDANGECVVAMPSYFDALNMDIRYQLTSIGCAAPSMHIKDEMKNGSFTIGGANPGQKVSWQITGVRQDALAKHRPIEVERDKSDCEKGLYLHPEAHGQSRDKSIAKNRQPASITTL